MRFLRPAILLFLFTFAVDSPAQEMDRFSKDTIKLRSDFLDEVQTIKLYIPKEADVFPVIYVLDEEKLMEASRDLPEAMFVIPDWQEKKSDQYLNYLEKELLYFIDSHYANSGESTIIGIDDKAVLASEILVVRPDVFDNYIIINPNFGPEDDFLNKRPNRPDSTPSVFLAAGSGNERQVQELQQKLKQHHYNPERLNFKKYSGNDFSGEALRDAFDLLFPKE